MRRVTGLAAAAVVAAAYATYEPRWFRLREREVPIQSSIEPLSILHVGDAHAHSGSTAVLSFLHELPDRLPVRPDLIVSTGDFVENDSGIDPVVEAFGRLDARLGKFYVFGSHDYYESVFTINSYTKYLTGRRKKVAAPRIDTKRLSDGLAEAGWHAVTNSDLVLNDEDEEIRITGVDDPYIWRERLAHVQRGPADSLAIGLMHSPDVVSRFALEHFDLIFAGHTHGGQVRLPGWGALVTNCSLDPRLASGLNRVGSSWLHVTPGLGTSRAGPIRFACRPEATLLRLRPTKS